MTYQDDDLLGLTVWCTTCQHTHLSTIPVVTYRCGSRCGFGAWYLVQAEEHATERPDHLVYAVRHHTGTSDDAQDATVAALRYAANLAHVSDHTDLAAQLYDAARNTAAEDLADSWSCPVCEEAKCDEGCPLEPHRVR